MTEGKGDGGRQRSKYLGRSCYRQGGNYGTIEVIHGTEEEDRWCSQPARHIKEEEVNMKRFLH